MSFEGDKHSHMSDESVVHELYELVSTTDVSSIVWAFAMKPCIMSICNMQAQHKIVNSLTIIPAGLTKECKIA